MLVKLDADLSVIFGTPIFARKSFLEPAANDGLEKAILARAAADQGVRVSNVGGWQWAASTGTDAQPWFRIFNPTLQGEKFDPQGDYVRAYVPEMAIFVSTITHRSPMFIVIITEWRKRAGQNCSVLA